ncbi:MAG: hypothetical protein DDG60_07755 [Anaerolineae bacterium]|nr:MAG: hypothetical protein DDG60_07755 [Anaerolineae bacterium]
MRVLTNEKLIERNTKIGKYTSLAALFILLGGMVASFIWQDNPNAVFLSFGALLFGFILSQIGIYFGNRFGRRPRVDERITTALKGLTKDYTLYHYLTPVNHLLVGPAGVWVIEPYYQRGTITYEKNRWRQKGGGLLLGYLKIFGQESLGRPDLEVQTDLEALQSAFQKALGDNAPSLHAVLVFYDERAELQAENAPHPTLKIDQLKDFLRKRAKENPLPPEQIKLVTNVLPQAAEE